MEAASGCNVLRTTFQICLSCRPQMPAAYTASNMATHRTNKVRLSRPVAEWISICPEETGQLWRPRCASELLSMAGARMKVLDPILWSTLHFSAPLRPNHRRHTFTTAATVCLGCGLSLNITCETYNLHWALRVTCTIEMFVTPSSTHVVLFIH